MTAEERQTLIVEHLPLVKQGAHRMASRLPTNVEFGDLVNAGVLGLLDAIEKFQPDRGVKFRTYAEVRVRGAILDSLRSLDWAPRKLRRKGREIERAYSDLQQQLGRPATDEEVATAVGEDLAGFHSLIDSLNGLTIGSFDGDANDDTFINYYPDDGSNDPHTRFEAAELKRVLAREINGLPPKERLVLTLYHYEELQMKEIARILNVNESRVSQLHSKAMLRLRAKLRPSPVSRNN